MTEGVMAMPTEWKRLWSPYRNYEVSSNGDVRRGGRTLKGHVDKYGYRSVLLSYAGISKRHKVSRLVCQAFHGDPLPNQQASHLDGNSRRDAKDNLAWETPSQNNLRKKEHGTHQAGAMHPRSKLTEADIAAIRASRLSNTEASKIFGVGRGHISRIRNGLRWQNPSDGEQSCNPAK